MGRRVSVHHFVVAGIVRPQSSAWRTSDLFGVSHWCEMPADTEFPFTVSRLQVFTRFYLTRAKPTNFRLRVLWEDHPSGVPEEVGAFGTYSVSFARDGTVRDRSFNLHNLRLQGVGTHTVELLRERVGTWDEGEWLAVARTYFVVER